MPNPTTDDEVDRLVRAYLGPLRRQGAPTDLKNKVMERIGSRRRGAPMRRLAAFVAVIAVAALVAGVTIAVHLGIHGSSRSVSTSTSTSSPISSPSPGDWQAVSLPSGFGAMSVSCPGAGDCWILGSTGSGASSVWRYSDGVWTSVSVPGQGILKGLTCVNADDCWAVGYSVPPGITSDGVLQPLIEYDDGAGFSDVSSPMMMGVGQLNAIACSSVNDCWAVGEYGSQNISQQQGSISETASAQPLVEHYDGANWMVVTVPAPSTDSELLAVTCVGTEDCWAVGQDVYGGGLTEHYFAGAWELEGSPDGGGVAGDLLSAVTCPAVDDCWAVGNTSPPHSGQPPQQPLVEHYAGTNWAVVASPHLSAVGGGVLSGIACTPSGDCWAVGDAQGPIWDLVGTPPPNGTQSLIEYYSGGSWEVVPSPQASGEGADLTGIACVPSTTECYATGDSLFESTFGA